MICGVVGIATVCFCPPVSPILGITAVILGTRANRAVRASAGSETGTGTAAAGVVTGLIALVLSVLVLAALVAVISLGLAGGQQHVIFRSICTGNGC
ncbi:MAG TPA: hypothetical protein VGR61_02370 [Candidatus Dormibacteraeota bacterium]|nr:hypothetical protein [Candidatus Dormibacteraeota bacterium]